MHRQYITFNPRRDGFLLFSDYDEVLLDKLRNDVSGAKWLPDPVRAWFVPNTIVPAQQLVEAVHDFPIVLDDSANAALVRLNKEAEFFERLSNAKRLDEARDGQPSVLAAQMAQSVAAMVPKAAPFQLAGIAYGALKQRCFIGDDMGTGKTLETLMILRLLRGFPALVVCKASAIGHWREEAELWTPGLTVRRWSTKHGWPTGSDADLTIMTWGQLSIIQPPESGKGKKIGWSGEAIVFDEIHRAKDRNSQRTKKATALSRNVRIRLGVTGSIDLNGKPIELVSQLGIIGRLKDMGGFWPFVKRYCGAVQGRYGWEMDGATNLEELARRLRQVCFVRRKKDDVLPQLPPKRREIVPVELSEERLAEYRRTERRLIPQLKQRSLDEARGLIDFHLKHLIGRAKVPAIVEWVGDFLEDSLPSEKLVLFAWHRDVIESLARGINERYYRETRSTQQEVREMDGSEQATQETSVSERRGDSLAMQMHVRPSEMGIGLHIEDRELDRLLEVSPQEARTSSHTPLPITSRRTEQSKESGGQVLAEISGRSNPEEMPITRDTAGIRRGEEKPKQSINRQDKSEGRIHEEEYMGSELASKRDQTRRNAQGTRNADKESSERNAASPLVVTLTGGDSLSQRERVQKRFREDPACRIFIANIEAGGESIELFSAATVLFAEFGWTPGAHDQAEDRCHRMGQVKSVIAYYFVAQKTVDEPIYDLIEEKRKNVTEMQQSVIGEMVEALTRKLEGGEEHGQ